jgi:hypothetical protein
VIDGLNQNSYTGYTSFDAAFTHTYNQLYLQIPLYAAFRINWSDHWSMTIGVGPYIGYGVGGGTMKELIRGVYGDGSTKTKWNTFGNGVYDEDRNYLLGEYLDPFDFGVGVNVNIEYKKYILGAGLESGILNVMNDNDDELSYRNINIRISAGYKF